MSIQEISKITKSDSETNNALANAFTNTDNADTDVNNSDSVDDKDEKNSFSETDL